ncbi:MAG: LysM peptidoglycan-binding domain-containing protein [Bacteroidota bacterium]|nr:LysM peptidoglycan-binding domain-containing protein [Bacteroidota bacterium]
MIKLLFVLALSVNAEVPPDSIGVETINGQVFVIHRVEEKETLFAISRRYRTTVEAILQYNASAESGLEIGQVLKVPYTARPVTGPQNGTVHKVQPKETLYSISRAYQVSVDDIRKWNRLADNSLTVGQELVIRKPAAAISPEKPRPVLHEQPQVMSRNGVHTVEQGQTLFSIARQYEVSVGQLRQWNQLASNELKVGQTLYVAQPERGGIARTDDSGAASSTPPVQSQPARQQEPQVASRTEQPVANPPARTTPTVRSTGQSAESIRISESLKTGDEIVEGGLAELIEGTEGNRKYLALHRTAPMGTILKVRNEMNNREVFVRVMGKLPDTAMTDKLLIKISRSAYDRLGAIDPRFRVEVTYYK